MAKHYLTPATVIESDSDDSLDDDSIENDEYEPPRSYVKVTGMKKVKELSDHHLKKNPNQQLWLLKIPKEIEVSKISSIPINSIGEPELFEVEGKQYKIGEDLTSINANNEKDQKYTLLQVAGSSSYKVQSDIKISRFFNVSQSVTFPEVNWSKVTTPKERVMPVEGLRMRHFPTGYYIRDYNEAKEPLIPEKKRTAEEVVVTEEEEPTRKHHKHKTEKKKKKHHHKH
ncbi:hypothetical protein FOA43_000761 [Brettanomyces nanus]|uniref:Uncharacterized protein n=1 Tax=Eeniella nana TaxID=13502 RepID=A0A875RNB8_EENNA|nr:uncharacterized protein FOA43_000761 [Brettanomyces nanus]QPG73450.1 hypothetical protein FOA43_000761 [Brettanomyces nanus]